MPFKSEAQRRFMYANHPGIAARWEKHTKDKNLPEKLASLVVDMERDTKANKNFRKVIYTGKLQLVLMSLLPNEDIGYETHKTVDQFFRVDGGSGKVVMNGKATPIKNGSAFVISAGTHHNVIAGPEGLKLYTIYAPPNHKPGKINPTKPIEKLSELYLCKQAELDYRGIMVGSLPAAYMGYRGGKMLHDAMRNSPSKIKRTLASHSRWAIPAAVLGSALLFSTKQKKKQRAAKQKAVSASEYLGLK